MRWKKSEGVKLGPSLIYLFFVLSSKDPECVPFFQGHLDSLIK